MLHIVLATNQVLQDNIDEYLLSKANIITNLKLNCFYLSGTSFEALKLNRLTVFNTVMEPKYVDAFFRLPMLKYVNLSYNHELHSVSLKNKVNYYSLIYLNLSHNKISDIGDISLKCFKNLEILDLSWNQIKKIRSKNVFNGLDKLNVLHLQKNNIEHLNVDCLEPLISLEVLNLTKNPLNINVIDICKRLKKLKRLSLPANIVQTLDNPENPENYNDHVLEVLDVPDNKIGSIDQTFFYSMINLRYLYLNNNQIESLNRDCFLQFKNLEYLNLSYNLIENLDGHLFLNLNNLMTLKLSNNKIKFLPDNVFANLRRLQLLDLSSNKITEIPPKIFKQNRLIRHLDLSNNSITVIAEDAFRYSNFKCVNLKHNTDLKKSDELTMAMLLCVNCLYIIDAQIINNNRGRPIPLRNPYNYVIQD